MTLRCLGFAALFAAVLWGWVFLILFAVSRFPAW